ncbi:MAG: PUA domain-containing protein, partial [Spirochaetota bacterium]
DVWNAAGGAGSHHGTGGMFTKVRAADMIMKSGNMMIIAKAGTEHVLNRIMDGAEIGTLFMGEGKILDSRKRWIAFNMEPCGRLHIDDGAVKALTVDKKSLLAAGIVSCGGDFNQGDAVEILTSGGTVIGRGITNYDCHEVDMIKGKKTSEIRSLADETFYEEVIHRDNMLIY